MEKGFKALNWAIESSSVLSRKLHNFDWLVLRMFFNTKTKKNEIALHIHKTESFECNTRSNR